MIHRIILTLSLIILLSAAADAGTYLKLKCFMSSNPVDTAYTAGLEQMIDKDYDSAIESFEYAKQLLLEKKKTDIKNTKKTGPRMIATQAKIDMYTSACRKAISHNLFEKGCENVTGRQKNKEKIDGKEQVNQPDYESAMEYFYLASFVDPSYKKTAIGVYNKKLVELGTDEQDAKTAAEKSYRYSYPIGFGIAFGKMAGVYGFDATGFDFSYTGYDLLSVRRYSPFGFLLCPEIGFSYLGKTITYEGSEGQYKANDNRKTIYTGLLGIIHLNRLQIGGGIDGSYVISRSAGMLNPESDETSYTFGVDLVGIVHLSIWNMGVFFKIKKPLTDDKAVDYFEGVSSYIGISFHWQPPLKPWGK